MIGKYESVDIFVGVDVGKSDHHAVALDRAGTTLLDRPLPNDEGRLRELIGDLKRQGRVLLVVDQPATIGALPVAVAQAEGVLVGYLRGLAMRRIADLHQGEAKTDACDASVIAQAARALPHALRSIQLADERIAELSMLCGFDDDLVKQVHATANTTAKPPSRSPADAATSSSRCSTTAPSTSQTTTSPLDNQIRAHIFARYFDRTRVEYLAEKVVSNPTISAKEKGPPS